jgi:hypothetical protein|tara:strand:- start:139 stop:528 length:390 start_codon:yes stop_codon:yes gene_type:complete
MAVYWEFQIEKTISGEVQDPNVFLSILDGKVDKRYDKPFTLVPNNFASLYVYSSFIDDGVRKRGYKNTGDFYNAPFIQEFVIVKMYGTEDEGIIDRDYIYLNQDGSLPTKELPQYVINAFNKCIKEGEK